MATTLNTTDFREFNKNYDALFLSREFTNKTTLKKFRVLNFVKKTGSTIEKTEVKFSKGLGTLTIEQIKANADWLSVIETESGDLYLSSEFGEIINMEEGE